MPREADVAVLLADIAGSTQIYEALGDAGARAVVAQCMSVMQDITRQNGGTPVKTTGDGVMSRFPATQAAAGAACGMQDRITGRMLAGGKPIAIRVGVHFGRALIERGDMFGDAVNLLARIAEQAKPGQILTTSEAVTHLSGLLRQSCRQIDVAHLRGRRDLLAIYELVWNASDATLMPALSASGRPGGERQGGGSILLVRGAWQATLRDSDPALAIGRGEQNDLVLPLPIVSRLHACIEGRNGRFVLTDRSANGTYVATDNGDAAYIHRDSHVLTGAGVLSLGEAPVPGSAAQIRFQTA